MNNLPQIANNETALARLAAVARQAQETRLLKFVKGAWLAGDDEIQAAREFIAHPHQLAQGWVKFVDGKVVDQRVGLVADVGFVLAKRDELGDTDSSKWERDPAGKPRDPWNLQYYLTLEDAKTGELFKFVTNSQGGNSAIGKLTNQFLRNAEDKGLPIVRLATGWYKHKTFGRVEKPEFTVTGWTHSADELVPPTADMADEIPF
jgi:hypothetical protein